jgi:hypothetical protein
MSKTKHYITHHFQRRPRSCFPLLFVCHVTTKHGVSDSFLLKSHRHNTTKNTEREEEYEIRYKVQRQEIRLAGPRQNGIRHVESKTI